MTDLKAVFIRSLETPALKEQVDVFFWYWKVIHIYCGLSYNRSI